MTKTYTTPDFDVTAYEIKDILTLEIGGGMDGDDDMLSWAGSEED